MLVLFDIDGTLLRRPHAHPRALIGALVEGYGIEVPPGENPVAGVAPWGKTDRQIVREVLCARGLDDDRIDAGLAALERRACELHAEASDPSEVGEVRQGTGAALAALRDSGHLLA